MRRDPDAAAGAGLRPAVGIIPAVPRPPPLLLLLVCISGQWRQQLVALAVAQLRPAGVQAERGVHVVQAVRREVADGLPPYTHVCAYGRGRGNRVGK